MAARKRERSSFLSYTPGAAWTFGNLARYVLEILIGFLSVLDVKGGIGNATIHEFSCRDLEIAMRLARDRA